MSEDSSINQQVCNSIMQEVLGNICCVSQVSVSDIDVDFLPIIHEIVKTIEKDPQVVNILESYLQFQ